MDGIVQNEPEEIISFKENQEEVILRAGKKNFF